LVIGDSITFACDIENRKNIFTSKFNDMLNFKSNRLNMKFLNMGVDGYNTIQEAENLKQNGLKI
jgi:hypothetical protein